MTDEELEKTMRDVCESLDKLSDPDKPLTKEEKKRKPLLLLKKETLERIKAAKEQGDRSQEIDSGIDYALLTSFGEKHPYLMLLAKSKFWVKGI